MFDYLQQFNNLPKDLRDKVSSPQAMAALAELEKKYQIDLAMAVMKVMIKSIAPKSLPAYFINDFSLSPLAAENLSKELTTKIFLNTADYLGLEKEVKALDLDTDINLIISEAGLVLPSSDLINRFKSILSTYLKGVRSKLAARDALTKAVNMGGLNLNSVEVDRVFKVCEKKTFKSLEVDLRTVNKTMAPQTRLDKIIASSDGAAGSEYNLKQAIASGQIKKLDTSHELVSPEKELDLPLPEKAKPIEKIILEQTVKPITPITPITPIASVAAVAPISPVTPVIKSTTQPVVKPVVPQQLVQSSPEQPISRTFKPAPAITITPPPFKTVVPPTPIIIPAPIVARPVASSRPIFSPSISKQAMHDIRPVPKVMGPLEELQFLDLVNFRRLGASPAEITAKIFSKIKLLEADGYDKMVLGVHAWRQSPVNRLYLKMVQEAIGKGMTIKDYVLSVQKENKKYLSWEEIEGILSMNSKLVF